MKKFFAVVAAALVIALALWVALRVQQANRQMKVTELLPKATLILTHVSDFKQTREQWHASDLYALWQEPALQAWLQKPLAELTKKRDGRPSFAEFLQLGPKNGFLALTSIDNNEPKFIGGFHFDQPEASARRYMEERKAPWLAKSNSAKRGKINYQEHQIETVDAGRFVLATVYDRNWFFAANDLASLKALLDRADRLKKNVAGGSLQENELFNSARKHLPSDYEGMLFIDLKPFVEKLLPLLAMTGQPALTEQWQKLKQVSGIAGSFGFLRGKMHETTFVAMPQRDPGEKLTRPSLAAASKDTFFYSASLTHWTANWPLSGASSRQTLPPFLQQLSDAVGRAGISQNEMSAAFGDEMEVIGEWAAGAQWPALSVSLTVRDAPRARKIADALTSVELAGASWARSEKDGVSYYSTSSLGGFVPISPALAVSDRKLMAGTDATAIKAAMTQRRAPAAELQKSASFHDAEAQVPAGESAFNYIDTQLLFERADAAVRPLLLMSATIYPAWGNKIDAAKLPPPDAIAKHLSPIAMSQRYIDDGYLSESVGPMTFNEASIGLIGVIAASYIYLQRGVGDLFLQATPTATPSPTPL
ncbi:MAG: hypothetical protein H0X34_03200 [Chthoniobacterales bacterium]|nr:hypothetical protein [Chthoniobacterales bacterium]